MPADNVAYPVIGAIVPHVVAAIGLIPTGTIAEAAIASAVGATVAWLVQQGLNALKTRFKRK